MRMREKTYKPEKRKRRIFTEKWQTRAPRLTRVTFFLSPSFIHSLIIPSFLPILPSFHSCHCIKVEKMRTFSRGTTSRPFCHWLFSKLIQAQVYMFSKYNVHIFDGSSQFSLSLTESRSQTFPVWPAISDPFLIPSLSPSPLLLSQMEQ